jgi:hypothetical protein
MKSKEEKQKVINEINRINQIEHDIVNYFESKRNDLVVAVTICKDACAVVMIGQSNLNDLIKFENLFWLSDKLGGTKNIETKFYDNYCCDIMCLEIKP